MNKLTKEQRAEVRKMMRQAHKEGKDVSLLATCPCSYEIAKSVKYGYRARVSK